MLEKLRERHSEESGFTLVELLVIMLILGILAAIAVPAFYSQRDKAKDSEAMAAVRAAQTAIETYANDNGGSYAAATSAKLDALESTLDPAKLAVSVPGTGTALYTVAYESENTPNTFSISREASGETTFACTPEGSDGCPAGGDWGG